MVDTKLPKLTYKQKAFIDAYLGEAKFNAYKAAKIAGYKGNGNTLRAIASENLTKPNIKAEVAAHFEANAVSREELVSLLADQARVDISSYYDQAGNFNLSKFKADGYGGLIKSIRQTKYGVAIEFIDKVKSQELIGRHLAIFTDRVESHTTHTLDENSIAALKNRIFSVKAKIGNQLNSE